MATASEFNFYIPADAAYILNKLRSDGFAAYIAGGAVRDMLRGITPHDYDIATSAKPAEIKRAFGKTVDTGIRHGTVTVIINRNSFEVTTFRKDGTYEDSRHPSSVEFITDPAEDCARRDFTVNAMMYSPEKGLLDFFGGRADIEKGIIRCVGDPYTRFCEDALRMLRALRFRACCSFTIEEETKNAVKKLSPLIREVSGERIRDELGKILLSAHPEYIGELIDLGLMEYIMPQLLTCFSTPQKNKYHIYNVGEHTMFTLKSTPPDIILRWAALLHDIGKPKCMSTDKNGTIHFYGHHWESRLIAMDILHRLRLDNESIKSILTLVENHDVRIDETPAAVKRIMARTGKELFAKLIILQDADNAAKNPLYYAEKKQHTEKIKEIFENVVSENQPFMTSQLMVNGFDLQKIGFRPGREIGDTLKSLLNEVIENPSLNSRSYLLERASQLRASAHAHN